MLAIDQETRELLRTPGARSVCLVEQNTGRALTTVGEADRTADATSPASPTTS